MTFNKDEFLRKLGKFVATLRRSKGMGQDKLTDEAGLAKGTVSKIESGNVDAKASTLARLAQALRVPVGKFFGARA